MDNNRIGIFAGIALLLIIGVIAGVFLMNDGSDDGNIAVATTDDSGQTRDKTERDPIIDVDPARGRTGSGTSKTDTSNNSNSNESKTPKAKIAITIAISGTAFDIDDDPVSGVTLTLLPEKGSETTGPTAVTNDEGRFTFKASVYDGHDYFVACLEESKAISVSSTFAVQKDTPVEGVTIYVYEAARAYGQVLNAADMSPLEGVAVELTGRDSKAERLGRLLGRLSPSVSDSLGNFSLEAMAPGDYVALAVKEGWSANPINPITRQQQEFALVEYSNLELRPFILTEAGGIEGRVLNKSDNGPVVGATVELSTILGGSIEITTTDEKGAFKFATVPPSMGGGRGGPGPAGGISGVVLRATSPGFGMGTRNVSVRSGQTKKNQDIILDTGCSVSGLVIDDKSQPIAGAKVYYNENGILAGAEMVVGVGTPDRAISTTTDDQGRFTLSGLPPGNVNIAAEAEGFANASTVVAATPDNVAETTLTLMPAGTIFGQVTDEFGDPIEGVPLAAYESQGGGQLGFIMKTFFGESLPDRGDSLLMQTEVKTDSEGRYRLEGLKPAKYTVVANSRDYEKHFSGEIEVKPAKEIEHNFTLVRGGRIYGKVMDAQMAPVANAAVTCAMVGNEGHAMVRTSYTDRNGNYEITGLPAGQYTVRRDETNFAKFILPDPKSRVTVKAGESVEFNLFDRKENTARIYGRITLDGKAYKNKSVVLAGGNMIGFAADTTTTDDRGYYEFNNVSLGSYQIAQGGGRGMPSLVRQRVYVNKAEDIEVNIAWKTVTIRGRVELEGGGVPEKPVKVFANPISPNDNDRTQDDEDVNELESMVFRETTTDKETGEFEIKGLSPGFYRVTARGDAGMVVKPYLSVKADVAGLVLILPRQSATLKGVVKGLDEAEPNTPFGLIGALTIEDKDGNSVSLGGMDNAVNLTDKKEYEIPNLAAGTYTVTMSISGYAPSTIKAVVLTSGETTSIEHTFESAGKARIVLENDDIGVESAYELTYEIRHSDGSLFKKRFTFLDFFNQDSDTQQNTDDNAFIISDLPPDSYTITLTLPGYKEVKREFTVIAGETTEVRVRFEKDDG